jgi:hypothetical protein
MEPVEVSIIHQQIMDKENIVHITEYYLTIKKKEIFIHDNRMELEIIMLGKLGTERQVLCDYKEVESRVAVTGE